MDISLHLDRSQQARVEAEPRADSKKTAQQVIGDADAAEKAKLEFARRANAQKVQELARATKTEQELAREAAAAAIKATRDQERAQQDKARLAKRLVADLVRNQEKLTASPMGGVKSPVQMGAAMMGQQSASAVISGFKAELDKAAANAQKTAEETLKMPGAIRELAALRGELGATGPTTAHVLGMQAQTLQSAEDVNLMERSGLGIGELAIGKTISQETFDKSMVAAGRMQTLEGGSASAYGALTGQIALQSDHMLSPEEVRACINRMYEIQEPGGVTNMSQAIEQNSQLRQFVMNGILTPEQSMGTLSAFSAVGPPGQAATTTNQFVRATLGNQVRATGTQVDPELDTEQTYEYFQRLGVDKENDPLKIGKAMAADLAAPKKANASFGPYLSPGNEFFADTAALRDPGSNSSTALREKTRSDLEREARRLNLKIEDPTSVFDVDRDQKLARQIQGAGGDVTGSTTLQSLESGAKSFERRMKRVEDALVPKVPAPVQGKPNQPRLRP